jgi:hypothetical protein
MKDFKEFIFEEFGIIIEAKDPSKDNLSQTAAKLHGHLENYIAPFLSADQRERSARNTPAYKHRYDKAKDKGQDGALYNPDPKITTHVTASAHPGVPKGTKVKVTGIKQIMKNGKPHHIVTTQDHGDLPITALLKPTELKNPARTSKGFQVESQISDNLGWEAAGSTKHGHDFGYQPGHASGVRGKVMVAGTDPLVRGESKLSRGKMGQSALNWDSEKGWRLTNEGLRKHFEKGRIVGPDGKERKILDHLNTFHNNGIIEKGFNITAPKGTARAYLLGTNKNVLHLHHHNEAKGIDHGTTFTVGDDNPLAGRTGMGHLSSKELDNFDGVIAIGATKSGSPGVSDMAHRPRETVMRAYANKSQEDPNNHMNLYDPDHAEKFKKQMKSIIKAHQA